jgi:hypothetical protein
MFAGSLAAAGAAVRNLKFLYGSMRFVFMSIFFCAMTATHFLAHCFGSRNQRMVNHLAAMIAKLPQKKRPGHPGLLTSEM